jgi:uncharacterized protein (DUF934 family)
MAKLIRGRAVVEDAWRDAGADGSGPEILPLATLLTTVAPDEQPAAPLGVCLQPGDEPTALLPYLQRLALIVVEFPKVGEGRGFSIAQLLRQRHGYRGELRARGALKRDQLFFLARCGFDSYQLDPTEDLAAALAAFDTFSVAYQRGSGHTPTLRHTTQGP